MRKDITIGDKSIGLAASAATPFIYQKVFHEDFLREMQKDDKNINNYIKLMFVMAKQADTATSDLMKGEVTENDFIVWLDQFEQMDVTEALSDALQLYQASRKGTSVPKQKAD